MRVGQGDTLPLGALPVVPPPEEDELVSSWLDRTARLYGRPLHELLAGAGRPQLKAGASAVDLGLPLGALAPIGRLLGLPPEVLHARTIGAAYPWATGLLARLGSARGGAEPPRLRYAACPSCLEQQRTERGFPWLRREWVFAPRTVCPTHLTPLVEAEPGAVAHPVWAEFSRRHGRAGQGAFGTSAARLGCGEPARVSSDERLADGLLGTMAAVQDALLAAAAQGQPAGPATPAAREARAAGDLAWALIRHDHLYGDRLAYDALASERLDSEWHMARRRGPGPVDYAVLPLDLRRKVLATATVLGGPPGLRRRFYPGSGGLASDLEVLERRLGPADRSEFVARRAGWPRAD